MNREHETARRATGRGPLAALNGGACDDPRVEIRLEDVARTIEGSRGLDAIVLGVGMALLRRL